MKRIGFIMNMFGSGIGAVNVMILLYAMVLSYLAYMVPREKFLILFTLFSLLFILMAYINSVSSRHPHSTVSNTESPDLKSDNGNISRWVMAGIFLRGVVLFSIPALSDDYFRFIWDGMLTGTGINPFLFTPAQLLESDAVLPDVAAELVSGMNSSGYFSIYPAVCQAVFAISWFIAGESVFWNIVVMRLFILAAEAGTLIITAAILKKYSMNGRHLVWYALNPVVIMELTANLHFEALMIFFLVLTWFLFLTNRFLLPAFTFALAVHVKLIPLILLPYIFFRMEFRKGTVWCGLAVIIVALMFLPLVSGDVTRNMSESLFLYFHTFEFNAGLYYVVREAGYILAGYNLIGIAGPFMAATGAVLIIGTGYVLAARKLNLAFAIVILFTIHLFFVTTVHPWYVMTIIAFSIFTGFRYPVIWTVVLPLSYHAYVQSPYSESVLLVVISYFIVITAIVLDWKRSERNERAERRLPKTSS